MATPLLLTGCLGGDGRACYVHGQTYYQGKGVDRDLPFATGSFENACRSGYRAGCGSLAIYEVLESEVTAETLPAADLAVASCWAGDPEGCTLIGELYAGEDYQLRNFGEVRLPANAPWALWAYRRGCDNGGEQACRAVEAMGEGPASPPGILDPAHDPHAAPTDLEDDSDRSPLTWDVGTGERESTNAFAARDRPWRGLSYYASGGANRSWSTATQASVIRIGVTALAGSVGGGFEIDSVTDSRWHPKFDRTYQRWLFRGHAAFQLEIRPDTALIFGVGGGAGTYRLDQDPAVFSGGLLQFVQLDFRMRGPGVLLAVRLGQQQLFQAAEGLPADHVTGLSLIVGRTHDL